MLYLSPDVSFSLKIFKYEQFVCKYMYVETL